jgi:hypothetical protein
VATGDADRLWGLFVLLATVAGLGSARADVIDVFNLSGVYNDGSGLSGTVTIDVTTGEPTALDAFAGGFEYATIVQTKISGGKFRIRDLEPGPVTFELSFQ